MRTLPYAATLLSAASGFDALPALAAALAFSQAPLPLDDDARDRLGLDDIAIRASAVRGSGALHALLIECDGRGALRDLVSRAAQRLSVRAPQPLWMLIALQRDGHGLAIAAWSGDRARPRIAALLCDPSHVLPSDAETLATLCDLPTAADVLTHARWIDVLGRDALTRRFYRALESQVHALGEHASGSMATSERRECALLLVSRLLFLSFLEAKGWLDDRRGFLEQSFADCMVSGGCFHRRVLRPLFFGTLNTPWRARAPTARALGRIPFLNGGLFARTPLERRCRDLSYSDESLGDLFGELLTRYRFTPREESAAWSEAAVDPEMLGRAFESLMASEVRRSSGAFFTPMPLVVSITRATLAHALAGEELPVADVEAALAGDVSDPDCASRIRARVADLRVVDPACGSGAFLVLVLEELCTLTQRLGDPRATSELRRELLSRAIFGVDINPTAVWLCELRLWLSVVIESPERDPMAVPPLPNLDHHIRVGDALAGDPFGPPSIGSAPRHLSQLRARYARASGVRKRTLERVLDRLERSLAIERVSRAFETSAARRRDLLAAARSRDLFGERHPSATETDAIDAERLRARELRATARALRDGTALPFAWSTHFPDIAARGGFDVAIGNPPWVRLHRIPTTDRESYRLRFSTFRHAAWQQGAIAARAGTGFGGQVDLAALFVERTASLLRPGGALGLLLPAKLWHSLAGGGTRSLLVRSSELRALEDWSDSATSFDAAVYPSVVIAVRPGHRKGAMLDGASGASEQRPIALATHAGNRALRWSISARALPLDDDPASPWLAVPSEVRAAFDRLRSHGIALAETDLGAPTLGAKCGCNAAFIVEAGSQLEDHDQLAAGMTGSSELAFVRTGERNGRVERALLRPVLRGEHVLPWRAAERREWIIWTHGEDTLPLPRLPPHAERWMAHWRTTLRARSDARSSSRWWRIFRTHGASPDQPRVVWADIGRTPRAMVLRAGDVTVPLNSCYVLPMCDLESAQAMSALLNSPLMAAWLNVIAEPARGRFHRYLAWTVALLPLPRDWVRARQLLAPLGERGAAGDPPSDLELLHAVTAAYAIRDYDVAPLLAWCSG